MYFSIGSNEIKKNFINIYSRKYDYKKLNKENALYELKKSYIQAIKDFIPVDMSCIDYSNPIAFLRDDVSCLKMSKEYNLSELDDLSQSDIVRNSTYNVSKEEADQYHEVLNEIKYISPDLYEVFTLSINIVFFMKSAGVSGGSTSGLPGVIWVNPKKHWDMEDKIEFFIHELTHNLLFLEELIHGLYSYENMYKEDYWTESAVLGKNRPLDKSFHSAVVATELLLYRAEFGILPNTHRAHPPTDLLIERTLTSIYSCLASPLLSKHGDLILKKCLYKLEENVIER